MHRYKIIVEYLGSEFVGWQRQNNGLSIQGLLEDSIYKFSKEQAVIFAAGRTDAGVHAVGQVGHFDLANYRDPYKVMHSINHFVRPYKVAVTNCLIVDGEFHARFSAVARHYVYRIINRSSDLAIDFNRAWLIKKPLDIKALQQGASYLIGTHDFTSFRAKHCQAKSAIKTLSSIEISKSCDEIKIYVSAPSFLHHMVRNIVGTLVLVGLGKWQPQDVKVALDAGRREAAGSTAPACGLYFLRADY